MGSTSPCNFLQRNSLYVCLSVWFLERHLASALALNAVACKNNHPIPVLRSTSAACKQSCGWEWFTVANPFSLPGRAVTSFSPQILTKQLTLSQPGRQIMSTSVLQAPLDLRHCNGPAMLFIVVLPTNLYYSWWNLGFPRHCCQPICQKEDWKTHPKTLLSRFYLLQTITDIRNYHSWNKIEWLLLQPTAQSHMHGLCVRFSALQISRQWMNDLYVEKIYSHFRFSKPRHYQSKSKRFVTSIGNIENTAVSLKLSGQTRLFLAALKISALLLKYPTIEDGFFMFFIGRKITYLIRVSATTGAEEMDGHSAQLPTQVLGDQSEGPDSAPLDTTLAHFR